MLSELDTGKATRAYEVFLLLDDDLQSRIENAYYNSEEDNFIIFIIEIMTLMELL